MSVNRVLTLEDLQQNAGRWRRCALTIGNYDGVHRGHQELIRQLVTTADRHRAQAVALTFAPHPVRFFRPNAEPFELTTLEQKQALLRHYGINETLVVQFDMKLAQLEPADFVRRILRDALAPAEVVVGYDFAFGRGARGAPSMLRELLSANGVRTQIVPQVAFEHEAVSSTRIRDALDAGDLDLARRLLGHPHALVGVVAHGAGRGRGLGFPTANLATENQRLPGNGVYTTILETSSARWGAITNVGVRPTFGGNGVTVESFVLDRDAPDDLDLYGQRVAVHLLAAIREERTFASPQQLVAQIRRDIDTCRSHLAADDLADLASQL